MSRIHWVWRRLHRDLQVSELRVLVLAVAIAVTAVTSVGFFTDRVGRAMTLRSAEVMAADLVLRSRSLISTDYVTKAKTLGLDVAELREFPSVIVVGEDMTLLVSVKAASSAYPLRGALTIADQPEGESYLPRSGPVAGTAWGDARLWAQSQLSRGATITLGRLDLTLKQVIKREPDRGQFLFDLAAPRLLIGLQDLGATGLVTEASRVRYRLLLAGDAQALDTYRRWFKSQQAEGLTEGIEIEGVGDERPALQSALDRAASYLGLASLSAVIIAGAAIALAAKLYARRQTDVAAVMRALGASQSILLQEFLLGLMLMACVGTLIGLALGYLGQGGLGYLAGRALAVELPSPSVRPVLAGLIAGLLMTLGFGLAPIAALRKVSVMRLIRRESSALTTSSVSLTLMAIAATTGLVFWQARDGVLAMWVLAVMIVLVLGLAGGGWLFFAGLRKIRFGPSATRYVLSSLGRRSGIAILQLCAFGAGIMALLLLMVIRVDLLDSWSTSISPQAPNHFAINIQPPQRVAFESALETANLASQGLFPMVRGRWAKHNGRRVDHAAFSSPRAQRLASREFNLSIAEALPEGNTITRGSWFSPAEGRAGEWSVEEGLAQALGIALGDVLTFRIAGEEVSGSVTSLRRVAWDSFQVNFFVIASPGLLVDRPTTYIGSFTLPPERGAVLASLIRQFPGVTVFDVGMLMEQVQDIIDQVSLVVQYVFVFTLLAGITVLIAAVQVGAQDRLTEMAILRALGAGRRRLEWGLLLEFLILGSMAGLLAAFFAVLAGHILAREVFDLPFQPGMAVWLVGVGGGTLGIGLVGLVAIRSVLRNPPLTRLQWIQN